jgi:hypothetical protein
MGLKGFWNYGSKRTAYGSLKTFPIIVILGLVPRHKA